MVAPESGIHLVRTADDTAAIDGFAASHGGRVGLAGVVSDLDRRARRAVAPGFAVHRALTWDRADRTDPTWWPQGITTSADGHADETFQGRRLVLVSWYARGRPGIRISVLDLDSRRYAHVLVVDLDPTTGQAAPLAAHAGGIVWHEEWLHVAATARGVHTCRLDDLVRLDQPRDGCRFALPLRYSYEARTGAGEQKLRYSFLSLDRAAEPPRLVVGEYGHDNQTRRLARYAVDAETRYLLPDDDGVVRPEIEAGAAAVNAQGGRARPVAGGTSPCPRSSSRLGSVFAGEPGALRRFRWGDADGPGGPQLVAVDRPALVGHRAPPPPLGLLHAAPALRPGVMPDRSATGGLSEAAGRAAGSGRPGGPRSPRPRRPPRRSRPRAPGWRAAP